MRENRMRLSPGIRFHFSPSAHRAPLLATIMLASSFTLNRSATEPAFAVANGTLLVVELLWPDLVVFHAKDLKTQTLSGRICSLKY